MANNISIIEQVLRDLPATRNSDKVLILEVWEREGLHLTLEQKAKFMALPTPESIRRTRQKFQEKGQYKAIDSVRKHRNFKGYRFQQTMPQNKPEKLPFMFDNWG